MVSKNTNYKELFVFAQKHVLLVFLGWRLVFVSASSFAFCIGLLLLTLKTPQDRKVSYLDG
jgi:hypothetical protein